MAAAVPILLYHDVTPHPRDPFAVTPEVFSRHMGLVAASGRTPLTVDAYAAGLLAGGAGLPARPVLVTFDDGYREFGLAVDAMAAAGVDAATLYLTTSYVQRPDGLPWADLQALPEWVQVGAHSHTHPQLDLLASAELDAEIRSPRTEIEQRLGRPCRSFAYPHGFHGKRVRRAVVEAGYASAAGVKNALSHPADDVYGLSRVTITQETADPVVEALLDGEGWPLGWRREQWRTKGFRAYRRLRGQRQDA